MNRQKYKLIIVTTDGVELPPIPIITSDISYTMVMYINSLKDKNPHMIIKQKMELENHTVKLRCLKKQYDDKGMFELMEEFEEYGYVIHICPDCGNECEPTEIDNDKAHCEICGETKNFDPII